MDINRPVAKRAMRSIGWTAHAFPASSPLAGCGGIAYGAGIRMDCPDNREFAYMRRRRSVLAARRSVIHSFVAGLIGLSLAAAPAAAQTRSETVFEPVGQSLSALLDEGWIIWTMAPGEVGYAFLLENDGRFVLCEVRPRPLPAVSFCHGIN